MSGPPERATVLDTSVLSNFAHVGRAELLCTLPRVVTVGAVREELKAGTGTHPYLDDALAVVGDSIILVDPGPEAQERERSLLATLDPGEAQALAVAETTEGTLVTDDGDARTVAKRRAVPVTGSIGLLVRFVEHDTLPAERADAYLKRWVDEAGFRAPARDIDVFLDG